MNFIIWLLSSLAIRFFIFDFYLLKKIREKILPNKLLVCPFCQGFWPGVVLFNLYYGLNRSVSMFIQMLIFGFISGYTSFIISVYTD